MEEEGGWSLPGRGCALERADEASTGRSPGLGSGEAGDGVPGLLPATSQKAMQEGCGTQVTES